MKNTKIENLETESNYFVICLGCQNSFHMDDCEPINGESSGYGEVYCKKCLSKRRAYIEIRKKFVNIISDEISGELNSLINKLDTIVF